jgi:2-oxoisovalerate dehydrogenase E2 component (dihydrolipoyl transacylase)
MARYSFKLPDIGEGIAEAEIVAWHVKIGDVVEEDDPLCDMMTDKATVEMTAPVAGKIAEVAGEVGDQIAIGSILAVFETEGGAEVAAEPLVETAPNEAAQVVKPDPVPEPEGKPEKPLPFRGGVGVGPLHTTSPSDQADRPHPPTPSPEGAGEKKRVLASPAVRERAKNLGIDLAQVKAEGDRIRHSDLDAFLTYNQGYRATGGTRPDEQIKVVYRAGQSGTTGTFYDFIKHVEPDVFGVVLE